MLVTNQKFHYHLQNHKPLPWREGLGCVVSVSNTVACTKYCVQYVNIKEKLQCISL